jgi:hypothetical protein
MQKDGAKETPAFAGKETFVIFSIVLRGLGNSPRP